MDIKNKVKSFVSGFWDGLSSLKYFCLFTTFLYLYVFIFESQEPWVGLFAMIMLVCATILDKLDKILYG